MSQIDNIHYIHLRCHSEFSISDGIVRIPEYTKKAKNTHRESVFYYA